MEAQRDKRLEVKRKPNVMAWLEILWCTFGCLVFHGGWACPMTERACSAGLIGQSFGSELCQMLEIDGKLLHSLP